MNSKEIIAALKANERPFGLMSEEMQAKARELKDDIDSNNGKTTFQYYSSGGAWLSYSNLNNFGTCCVYRLRPDYAPKPRLIECEVYEHDRRLRFKDADGTTWSIDYACGQIDFIGFKYEDGNVYPQPVMYSENGGLHFISQVDSLTSGKDIVNRPTHVLFKGVAK